MSKAIVLLWATCGSLSVVFAQELTPRAVPVVGNGETREIRNNPEQDWFDRAVNLYQAAKKNPALYPSAIEQMESYIGTYPSGKNATRANLYLGQLYYQSGLIPEARRVFEKLLSGSSRDAFVAAAAYTLGYDAFTKEDYRDAGGYYAIYGECAGTKEERARGLFLAAASWLEAKDEVRAQSFLQKIASDPTESAYTLKAQMLLGKILYNQKRYPEALVALKLVAERKGGIDPASRAEANVLAGQVSLSLNQAPEAKLYFEKVMNEPELSSQRDAAALGLLKLAELEKDYPKLLSIWRDSGLSTKDLATVDPAKAAVNEEGVPKAELIDEQRIERLLLVGKALKITKETADAMRVLVTVEELLPKNDRRRFEAGYSAVMCQYQLKEASLLRASDEFLKSYQSQYSKEKRYQMVMWVKATSLVAAGKNEPAAELFRQINTAEFTPDNVHSFLQQKGESLSRAGDYAGAILAYSDFLTRYPQDPNLASIRCARAYAHRMSLQFEKAMADCEWVLANTEDAGLRKRATQEAAQTQRAAKKPDGLIAKYRDLLQIPNLSVEEMADANLNIGYGYLQLKDGVKSEPFLLEAMKSETEEMKRSARYGLIISYHQQQNYPKLSELLTKALNERQAGEIPTTIYWWAGKRGYNLADFASSARFLSYIADYKNPTQTDVDIWRYLAKALYADRKYTQALVAVENEIKIEKTVDGELDHARILYALKRFKEAREVVDAASEGQAEGVLGAGLRMLAGDLFAHEQKWDEAANCYGYVIEFIDDNELKPRAMARMVRVLKAKGDADGAAKYQARLKGEFPDWKEAS